MVRTARTAMAFSAPVLLLQAFPLLSPGVAGATGETLTVVLGQVDGAGPFNADDAAGHDSNGSNGIVRTNDTITYQAEVLVADQAATDVTVTIVLPKGTQIDGPPPFCGAGSTVTPATMPAPAVPTTTTSWTTLPIQTLVCKVGARTANSTLTYPIAAEVRPEVPNGTKLGPVSVSVTSADVPTPSVSNTVEATVSARAQVNISKNSVSLTENSGYFWSNTQTCATDPSRMCAYFSHGITLNAPYGGKGLTPLKDGTTFVDDLTPASLYPAGVTSSAAWTAAGATALQKYGARLVGCTPLGWATPGNTIGGVMTETNSVRNSGTTTCTQTGGPGSPVNLSISGMDSTAYTSPTEAVAPVGMTLPADRAYFYSMAVQMEIPIEAVTDLGIATPAGSPSTWVLNWDNKIKDLTATGIDGVTADPAANAAFDDHRASTTTVTSTGNFDKLFTGVPGAVGNVPPSQFNPGWGVWEGPAGSTGTQNGEGQLFPGERTISSLILTASTVATQADMSFLACDSWDPTRLQLAAGNYPGSATLFQQIPSNGAPVWVSGGNRNGAYFDNISQTPAIEVQYGTGIGGAGASSSCDDANSPTGWTSDPSQVPGNDPVMAAQGVYTAVSRVRVGTVLAPSNSSGTYLNIAIGLQSVSTLPTATILPNWAAAKIWVGDHTTAELLGNSTISWGLSDYNPVNNSGNSGDRLRIARASARIRKEVKNPSTGAFGTSTPQFTGGQTAEYRLTPSLTAGISTAVTVPMVIEDCLPVGQTFASSSLAPSIVSGSTPAGAGLTCAAGETYVKWDLGEQPINVALTPVTYTVTVSPTATSGTEVNKALVTAEGDPSSVSVRTATASIQVVQPAGVVIDKTALTPLIEVNRAGETTKDPLLWRIDFANLDTSPGPSDIDLIDVLPKQGVNFTNFTGTLAFDHATVLAGNEAGQTVELLYTKAATVDPDATAAVNNATTGSTVWCSSASGGSVVLGQGTTADCPASAAEVTGVRVRRSGTFGPSDKISVEVGMIPSTNTAGDVYVNVVAGRATGLSLLVGPAAAPERVVDSSIGDTVFRDANANGVQDAGEAGIADFAVTLTGTDSDGNVIAPMHTSTDPLGHYVFNGLQSGNYTVTFAPSSLTSTEKFTWQNKGYSDLLDSDGDPVTGVATVVLSANFDNVSVDQGVISAKPSIALVKKINDDDANTAPGVAVPLGSTMNVTYEITNNGTLPLDPVVLTDDVITSGITCPKTALAVGETMTCTASYPAPKPGIQHTNTGTVTGTPPVLPDGTRLDPVTDTDPANAIVLSEPAIHVEKYVVPNGVPADRDDADAAPGVAILVGGTATWEYEVTNPGNTALAKVGVRDDNGTATTSDDWTTTPVLNGTHNVGDTNGDDLLDPGETWRFVSPVAHTLTVTDGTYTNIGTATGTPNYPGATPITDTDPANLHGIAPDVTIVKNVQTTFDADKPTGPMVATGSPVKWTYTVTNSGTTPLTDVTVTDDKIADDSTIDCTYLTDTGDNVISGPVPVGASFVCVASGTAIEGQYTNVGTVTGVGPTRPGPDGTTVPGEVVTDNNAANYFGALPKIDIEKFVQTTFDADQPSGPLVAADGTVKWTYIVTNTGKVPLTNVVVTDDRIANDSTILCEQGTKNVIGALAVGDSVMCTAYGTAITGPYVNVGTATGVGPKTIDVDGNEVAGKPVIDTDAANYFGAAPAINVKKYVQTTFDADTAAEGPLVTAAGAVHWVYVVTNTGNVAVDQVKLTDDIEGAVSCPKTLLSAGESMECTLDGTAISGPYENKATVTGVGPETIDADGNSVTGTKVTDTDLAHYSGIAPHVSLVKYTQTTFDADTTTGQPLVKSGDPVKWTYKVTNDGNTVLTDVTVTDDQIADDSTIDCGQGTKNVIASLAIDETVVCTATGIATDGQYANTGSVTGNPPATVGPDGKPVPAVPVTATNPSHYYGVAPAIDVEKYVQTTFDADTAAEGPLVAADGAVHWVYVVTNTGNVALDQVTLTDDVEGAITCPKNVLAAAESMECTLDGTAIEGPYENKATATGVGPKTVDTDGKPVDGTKVTDTDLAHYEGIAPHVSLVKYTQTIFDADTTYAQPLVKPGDAVKWTYKVTNDGNTVLTDATVTDDQIADDSTIDCGQGTKNVIASLAIGETVLCTATGVAIDGQYENVGSVTGNPPPTVGPDGKPVPSVPVTATNPSHYYGPVVALSIVKKVQGDDAETAPGPNVTVGDKVTFTYTVTNTGNSTVTDIAVTDDIEGDVTCPKTELAVGESMECTLDGVAVAGQYVNTGTVTGVGPETVDPDGKPVPGEPVIDTNIAHYNGQEPHVSLVKNTQTTFDADTTDGQPLVKPGSPVKWTYRVTNDGNTVLTEVTVTDDQIADDSTIDCGQDTKNVIASLAVGETVVCTAMGIAIEGQYANVGSVTGNPPPTVGPEGKPIPSVPVTAVNPSHYYGPVVALSIVKKVQGDDAEAAPGPNVTAGDKVTFTYTVTNTGNSTVTDIAVTDDVEGDVTCPKTELAAGESMECALDGVAVAGQYVNTGAVTGIGPETVDPDGKPVPGEPVIDTNVAHYNGQKPHVSLVKFTQTTFDADTTDGQPLVKPGTPVKWTYKVTNDGNTVLADVTVTDDQIADDSTIDCGQGTKNVIASLAVGETVVCTATGIAIEGQYANVGSVTGTPPPTVGPDGKPVPSKPVTGTNESHYYGPVVDLSIVKSVDGDDAETAPGPTVTVGDTVTFTYTVTNTGNTAVTGIHVTDDIEGDVTCPKTVLVAGESMDCTLKGKAVAGQYVNVGTVTGVGPETVGPDGKPVPGEQVTDSNKAHYFGKKSPTPPTTGPTTTAPASVLAVSVVPKSLALTSPSTSTSTHGALAMTGATIATTLLVAFILMLSGLVLLGARRRRKEDQA